MSKFVSLQWKWNKFRHFFMGHIQIWHLFLSKRIKVFQWLSKPQFLNCMTKVNPNHRNETKSDIFPWDIFKSDVIFIARNILKYFNDFDSWHFSISLQVIQNYLLRYLNEFEIYFLVRFMIKGNWTQTDLRSIQHLGYHKNV